MRRVISGRAVSSVSEDHDLPFSSGVYWYMKRDKEFAEKYKAVIPLLVPIGKRARKKNGEVDGKRPKQIA